MKVSTPVNDCEKNTREQDNDIFDTLYATTHESNINPIQTEIDTIENRLGEINLLNIINNNDRNDDIDIKDIHPPVLRRYTNDNTYDEVMELRLQHLNKQITSIGDKIDNKILLLQCKQKMKELESKLEYLTELSK
jgi:hypothetical protein